MKDLLEFARLSTVRGPLSAGGRLVPGLVDRLAGGGPGPR